MRPLVLEGDHAHGLNHRFAVQQREPTTEAGWIFGTTSMTMTTIPIGKRTTIAATVLALSSS
jgi:hypothetical protein